MTDVHRTPTFREYSVAGRGMGRPEAMSLHHATLLAAAAPAVHVVVRYGQHVAGRHGCGPHWTDWLDLATHGRLGAEQVAALLAGRDAELPAAA